MKFATSDPPNFECQFFKQRTRSFEAAFLTREAAYANTCK